MQEGSFRSREMTPLLPRYAPFSRVRRPVERLGDPRRSPASSPVNRPYGLPSTYQGENPQDPLDPYTRGRPGANHGRWCCVIQ